MASKQNILDQVQHRRLVSVWVREHLNIVGLQCVDSQHGQGGEAGEAGQGVPEWDLQGGVVHLVAMLVWWSELLSLSVWSRTLLSRLWSHQTPGLQVGLAGQALPCLRQDCLRSLSILQACIILPSLQHVHVNIRHLDLLQPPVSHLWAPCAPPQVDEVHLLRLLPNSHAQVQQQSLSCMQQLTP